MTGHGAIRALLLRGMLAGLLAGVIAVGFAELFGEPPIERAIAFEAAHAAHAEPELVSRAVQRGWGLLVGAGVYGTALGGLFALAFAACHRRIGRLDPRGLALALAGVGLVAVVLVPQLKYPSNPPAVGEEATIGLRTAVYFEMIAVSLMSLALAIVVGIRLVERLGRWNGALAAAALYLAAAGAVAAALPAIDEVPRDFPADLLWRFRISSFGMQTVLWLALGLIFGPLAERVVAAPAAVLPRLRPARRRRR